VNLSISHKTELFLLLIENMVQMKLAESQIIVISRCRVDIPPPTLLIGSDVIKVVPKVKKLGFFE
jgi:hypothetical protein